jgi:hypothetical protein
MRLKYKVSFIAARNGWVVWKNRTEFFTTTYATEVEAQKASLLREGDEIVEKLDDVQRRMESIPGFIDSRDPYGWRA